MERVIREIRIRYRDKAFWTLACGHREAVSLTRIVRGLEAKPRRSVRTRWLQAWSAVAIAVCPGVVPCADVVSWGDNDVGWNHRLGVTEIRMGCDLSPNACMQRATAVARAQGVHRVSIAIPGMIDTFSASMREYGVLSRSNRTVVAIGIDDFLSVYQRWILEHPADAPGQLVQAIHNLKTGNPAILFSITLYEDDLDTSFLRAIPPQVREAVDRISLFLHYRTLGSRFSQFVADAKRQFPRAAIIAGVYAYDRIDYIACDPVDQAPCTEEEQARLFAVTLDTQLEMIRSGILAGIELYPGRFGHEDEWEGWTKEGICQPARRANCVANTKRLRGILVRQVEKNGSRAATD